MFATEGIPGMLKGYSLNIIKGPITLSLSLTTYDLLRGIQFPQNDHNGNFAAESCAVSNKKRKSLLSVLVEKGIMETKGIATPHSSSVAPPVH